MADVVIVVNDAEVRQMLERAPGRINVAMRQAMSDATSRLWDQLRTYPPPPNAIQGPRSRPVRFTTKAGKGVSFIAKTPGRYVRTMTLHKSWHIKTTGRGVNIEGRVFSDHTAERYARYVQDAERQAGIHQGRWNNTVQQVSERNTAWINEQFDARIRAALR